MIPGERRSSARGRLAGLAALALLAIAGPAHASGAWLFTGTPEAQYGERASRNLVTLHDGTALLIGGRLAGGGAAEIVERYRPDTGGWQRTGSLQSGRSEFTATVLADGRVLVAGGASVPSGGLVGTAEIYDPATGAWQPTGPLNLPRLAHTATLLPSGRVLVSGGQAGTTAVSVAEIFDPTTGAWTVTGVLNEPRRDHLAVLLRDGRVLVAGGARVSGASPGLASAEIYDPATGLFSLTRSMNVARPEAAGLRLPDGSVLVAGGSASASSLDAVASTEIYDPESSAWLTASPLPVSAESLLGPSLVPLPDGAAFFLAVGTSGTLCGLFTVSAVYDPTTRTWSATAALPAAFPVGVTSMSATAAPEGRVLVAGGTFCRPPSLPPPPIAALLFLPDGSPAARLTAQPETIDFGAIRPGQVVERTATLTNTGGTTLAGTAAASAPFGVVSGAAVSLEPGASATLTIRFAPTAFGAFSESLAVDSSGGRATIALTGMAGVELSGRVTAGGAAAEGVRLALRGAASAGASTDTAGRYALVVAPGNGYTITPEAAGYRAEPASRSVVVASADVGGLDFVLTLDDAVAAFVGGLYERALDRSPDPAGLDGWVAYVRSACGADREAATARAFLDSGEFRSRALTPAALAAVLYQALLGREPEPAGLSALVAHFSATRVAAGVQGFAHSPEFLAMRPASALPGGVETIVERFYQVLLGRTPGAPEVAAWAAHVRSTGDFDTVVAAFLASPEFAFQPLSARDVVDRLYRALLGRPGDSASVEGWEGLFRSDLLAVVDSVFVPSGEFRQRAAGICR